MKKLSITSLLAAVLILGCLPCAHAQVIHGVVGTPLASLGASPSSHDYSTVNVGATSNQAYTITNNGTRATTLGATPVTLTTGTDYNIVAGNTCANATLNPSGTCSVTVQFAPTGTGTKTDTLNVAYKDYGSHDASPLTAACTGVGGASCTTIAYDCYQDFEFTTLDASNLQANDHCSQPWIVNDANSMLSTSTTQKQSLLSCPNGTPVTSTKALAFNTGNGAHTGSIYVWFPASITSANASFWFRTGTKSNYYEGAIFTLAMSGDSINLYWGANTTTNQIRALTSGGSGSGTVTVANTTWYWIDVYAVKGGTSKIHVKDTSGTDISGSPITVTAPNNNISAAYFGSDWNAWVGTEGVLYWDEPLVRWNGGVGTPAENYGP